MMEVPLASSAQFRRRRPRGHNGAMPEFLEPKSTAAIRELARMIAVAEWAPDCYRNLDGNYIVPKLELAIMHGASVGLSPLMAVQSIALFDGSPTIRSDGALALVERSGLLEDMTEEFVVDEAEGLTAISAMRRRHQPTPISSRFSMAMAEQAGLTRKEGPWQSYPQRCLMMRARSWSLRDGFADVLRGLAIREEVEDYSDAPRRRPATEMGLAGPRAQVPPSRPATWQRPRFYTLETSPSFKGSPATEPAQEGRATRLDGKSPVVATPAALVTATREEMGPPPTVVPTPNFSPASDAAASNEAV